jgi:hypothetical protein
MNGSIKRLRSKLKRASSVKGNKTLIVSAEKHTRSSETRRGVGCETLDGGKKNNRKSKRNKKAGATFFYQLDDDRQAEYQSIKKKVVGRTKSESREEKAFPRYQAFAALCMSKLLFYFLLL